MRQIAESDRRVFVPPDVAMPDTGNAGDPLTPVLDSFMALGVRIGPSTASDIRRGVHRGIKSRHRLVEATIANNGSIANRDIFFAEYGIQGIMRREKRTDDDSHAFKVRKLKEQIAGTLGVTPGVLGELVRLLRIDLMLTPPSELGASFPIVFQEAVASFFQDFAKYKDPQTAEQMRKTWKQVKSINGFYRMLFAQANATVALWLPYEAEPIFALSSSRLKHASPITPFSSLVLAGVDGRRTDRAIVAQVESNTGITIPKESVSRYRALLTGRITVSATEAE